MRARLRPLAAAAVSRDRGRPGRSWAWGGRTSSSGACARRRGRSPRSGRRVAGRSSTPACGVARRDRSTDVVDAVLEPQLVCRAARPGPRRGGRSRGRGRRPAPRAAGRSSTLARRAATSAQRPGVDHGGRHRHVGRRRAERLEPRARAPPTRSNPSGRPESRRWMAPHGQLVLDQLDDVAPCVGAGLAGVAVGAALALAAVGERGLVAVVAVGDHDRLARRPRRRWRAHSSGSVDDPDRVAHAVVVGRRRRAARRRRASRSVRPLASDSPQIADRLARHDRSRSSRSLLAFGVVCSWGRMSAARRAAARARRSRRWCGGRRRRRRRRPSGRR